MNGCRASKCSSRHRHGDVTVEGKRVFVGAPAKPVVEYAPVCVVFIRSSAILYSEEGNCEVTGSK